MVHRSVCGPAVVWTLRPHELTHADYVARASDQIRMNVASMPDLCVALLQTLGGLVRELDDLGLARDKPLRRQARLVVAGAAANNPLAEDLAVVRQAAVDAGFGEEVEDLEAVSYRS